MANWFLKPLGVGKHDRWCGKIPYLVLAAALLALAGIIAMAKLPKIHRWKDWKGFGVLRHSHLTLGVIGIFMYVGGEVAIGSWLVNYFEKFGALLKLLRGRFVAYYWGGAMIGRFMGQYCYGETVIKKLALMSTITLIAVVTVYFVTDGSLKTAAIVLVLVVGNGIAFAIGKSSPQEHFGYLHLLSLDYWS